MNFVGRPPPGKPGGLSGIKYRAKYIQKKNIRLFRTNTTTVFTGERANDLASEWYLVSFFLKPPGCRPLVLLQAARTTAAVVAAPVLAGGLEF